MRLQLGQKVTTNKGRKGIITELDYKNNIRTLSVEPTDEGTPFWCYKSQIVELYNANGMKLY